MMNATGRVALSDATSPQFQSRAFELRENEICGAACYINLPICKLVKARSDAGKF
jgi:hypothetical protein